MKKIIYFMLLVLFLLPIAYHLQPVVYSYAAMAHLINYQGRLTDKDNKPLEGSYTITFRIYDAATAGNLLWQETQPGVVVQKGIFSVLLGSTNGLDNLAFDKQYYLEIVVGSEVMSPRQLIGSAAYVIAAVPKGVIVMWSGAIANIPSGWALCDGANGTPDLRDRFIVGATQDNGGVAKTNVTGTLTQSGDGQISTHTHGVGTLTVGNESAHTHSTNINSQAGAFPPSAPMAATGVPGGGITTGAGSAHTHTLSGSIASYGTGVKNVAVYYALAFIMKL